VIIDRPRLSAESFVAPDDALVLVTEPLCFPARKLA
jgi:hypothetical protein